MAKTTNRKNQRSDLRNYLERGYRVSQQRPKREAEWAKIAEDEGASIAHLKKWAKIANAFIHCAPSESAEVSRIVNLHVCDEALETISYRTYTRPDRERFLDIIEREQQRLGRLLSQGETLKIIDHIKGDKVEQGNLFDPTSNHKAQGEALALLLRQTLPVPIYEALVSAIQ